MMGSGIVEGFANGLLCKSPVLDTELLQSKALAYPPMTVVLGSLSNFIDQIEIGLKIN